MRRDDDPTASPCHDSDAAKLSTLTLLPWCDWEQKALLALSRACKVVLVGEYKTSKMCHACGVQDEPVASVLEQDARTRRASCKTCRSTVDRDMNASAWIATIVHEFLAGRPRPKVVDSEHAWVFSQPWDTPAWSTLSQFPATLRPTVPAAEASEEALAAFKQVRRVAVSLPVVTVNAVVTRVACAVCWYCNEQAAAAYLKAMIASLASAETARKKGGTAEREKLDDADTTNLRRGKRRRRRRRRRADSPDTSAAGSNAQVVFKLCGGCLAQLSCCVMIRLCGAPLT